MRARICARCNGACARSGRICCKRSRRKAHHNGLGEQWLFPVELSPARRGPETPDAPSCPGDEQTRFPESTHLCSTGQLQVVAAWSSHPDKPTRGSVCPVRASSTGQARQIVRRSASSGTTASRSQPEKQQCLTIERAVQQCLQAHRSVGHRPKTLEWHRTALGHFQACVQTECHLLLVQQMSETTIGCWLASLAQAPTARGTQRSASTTQSYARSVRAFCQWLVERGVAERRML